MSKSKSLVPLPPSVAPEKHRRRFVGFLLVLVALVILLPEWERKVEPSKAQPHWPLPSDEFSERLQTPPELPSIDGELPFDEQAFDKQADPYAAFRDLEAKAYDDLSQKNNQPVASVSLEEIQSSPWQAQYENLEQSQPQTTADLRKTAEAQKPQPQTQAIQPDHLKPAWFVQVASLVSEAGAQNLLVQLKSAGFRAELQPFLSGDQYLYRVMVGPQLRRQEAENTAQSLKKEFKFQPILKTYYP